MKIARMLLIAGISIFSLSSCTKLLYSHEEYMNRFRTKEGVIAHFGLPDQKIEEGDYTQWLFDFGKGSTGVGFGNANTNASIYGNKSNIYGNSNTNAGVFTQVDEYDKYVKFTFDKQGMVKNWTSQGVNLSRKQIKKGATIVAVVAVIAACVELGALAAE